MIVTPELLILNHAVALEQVGGDQELLIEVAQLFLEDYPNSLREIEEALRTGDAKLMERAAHTLKGAAANFGAEPVVEPALRLEMAGRRGNLSAASGDFAQLTTALRGMHQDLERISAAR